MTRFYVLMLAVSVLVIPETAAAYVGPGAGLSLLSALWALLLALFTALVFAVAWPLRQLLRRRRAEREASQRDTAGYDRAEVGPRKA
jgi:membrane protein implicated in regulation of membrane protease activity